jgi:hypothetical protein
MHEAKHSLQLRIQSWQGATNKNQPGTKTPSDPCAQVAAFPTEQRATSATHCGNTPTHDCTQRRQHYRNATKVAYQPALAFPPPNHRAPRCACTGCHLASANGRPSDGTWPFHAFMRDAAPTDSVAAMPRGPCQQLQQGRGHHGCCWNHAITYASSGQRIQAGSTQTELEVHTHTPPVHGVVAMHECILVS